MSEVWLARFAGQLSNDEVQLPRSPGGRWEVEPLADTAFGEIALELLAHGTQVAQDSSAHRRRVILKAMVVVTSRPDRLNYIIQRCTHSGLIA